MGRRRIFPTSRSELGKYTIFALLAAAGVGDEVLVGLIVYAVPNSDVHIGKLTKFVQVHLVNLNYRRPAVQSSLALDPTNDLRQSAGRRLELSLDLAQLGHGIVFLVRFHQKMADSISQLLEGR